MIIFFFLFMLNYIEPHSCTFERVIQYPEYLEKKIETFTMVKNFPCITVIVDSSHIQNKIKKAM